MMHGIKFEALNHLTQHIMLLYYYTLPAHLTPSLLKKKKKKRYRLARFQSTYLFFTTKKQRSTPATPSSPKLS